MLADVQFLWQQARADAGAARVVLDALRDVDPFLADLTTLLFTRSHTVESMNSSVIKSLEEVDYIVTTHHRAWTINLTHLSVWPLAIHYKKVGSPRTEVTWLISVRDAHLVANRGRGSRYTMRNHLSLAEFPKCVQTKVRNCAADYAAALIAANVPLMHFEPSGF